MKAEDFDFRDLRTVEQIAHENQAACPGARLRWWIERADSNGFRQCLVRVGRTVQIHEPRFNRWLLDHLGLGAR